MHIETHVSNEYCITITILLKHSLPDFGYHYHHT